MLDYKITKEFILLADVMVFEDFNNFSLIVQNKRRKRRKKELRKVVFVNHHIIDFLTGEEIKKLPRDYSGYVISPIYKNIMYYNELYKCPNVTDNDLLYAAKVYETFLARQELIQKRKIIKFPQKRLY